MSQAEQLADRIQRVFPNMPRGSLRFWGEWFGKPYDNQHTLTNCRAKHEILRLFFDDSETISVW
jgi:hypothetical protein